MDKTHIEALERKDKIYRIRKRHVGAVADLGADAYSLDSSARLSEIMEKYGPGFCLQGNLPASVLSEDSAEAAAKKTFDIISDMQSSGKHIFNLGHGIRPDAKLENVEAMCETVKNFKA